MPPLPKRKRSKARQGDRQAHTALKMPNTSPCPNCGNAKIAHRACTACGYYNGRQVAEPRRRAETQ
jgi:large subunit ribosomal protein L32